MEITFETILNAIRKSIVVLLIVAVIAGALAYVVSAFVLPPTYVSTVKLNIIGTKESEGGLVENNNSWVYANRIIKTCAGILETNDFKVLVANKAGLDHKPTYTVSFDEDTTIIAIKVQESSPEAALKVAKTISEAANEHLVQMNESSVVVKVIETPQPPKKPSSPNIMMNVVIVVIAAMAVVLVIQILRDILGTTVKDEDELQKRYEIPVIASIPDFNEAMRNSSKYSYTEYVSRGNK